ncbi:predicted protein [Botrytis cinerea T4]|uniref:Uncharacterized protein n=1 Tax=Botryotinia fuckeliana (strain T4) TaxID=999810 RepID=G2Y8H8_BOTF4|nr:predicted protein [Botrytis cinerea T4]
MGHVSELSVGGARERNGRSAAPEPPSLSGEAGGWSIHTVYCPQDDPLCLFSR